MFNKEEPEEAEVITALRQALYNKDTRLMITSRDGRTWTMFNDKLRGCALTIDQVLVSDDEKDAHVSFRVMAINGKIE